MQRNWPENVLGCCAVAAYVAFAGEAAAFSVTYDQKVTARGMVQTSRVMLKDERFRIETAVGGTTSVVIRNAEGLYLYLPDEQIAMQMPAMEPTAQWVERPADYLEYLKERNARLIRTETVDGQLCDVYEFTSPSTGAQTTAWVSPDKRFPLRLEMDGPQGRMTAELSNIVLGSAIPDAMFQLPSGIQLMPMGQVMPGLEGLPDLKLLMGDDGQ